MFSLFTSLPEDINRDCKILFMSIFHKDVIRRPDAEACLDFEFFRNHLIPRTLPIDVLSNQSKTNISCVRSSIDAFSMFLFYFLEANVFFSKMYFALAPISSAALKPIENQDSSFKLDDMKIALPKIRPYATTILQPSYNNIGYSQTLHRLYTRFESICEFFNVSLSIYSQFHISFFLHPFLF